MEGSSTQVARRAIDAYNLRDAEALRSCTHPKIDFRTLAGTPDERVYDGHDGLRQWLTGVGERFDQAHFEVDDVSVIDGRTLILGRSLAQSRDSQTRTAENIGLLFEFSAGDISRWYWYADQAAAIEAAEMAEC